MWHMMHLRRLQFKCNHVVRYQYNRVGTQKYNIIPSPADQIILLVKQLHKCSLNFLISSCSLTEKASTNGIDFIYKNDTRLSIKTPVMRTSFDVDVADFGERRMSQSEQIFIVFLPGDHEHNRTFL